MNYGKRLRRPPFAGDKFFITSQFKKAKGAEMKMGHLKSLIVEVCVSPYKYLHRQLGEAQIIDSLEDAKYVIGANDEKGNEIYEGKDFFNWSSFLAWILSFMGLIFTFSERF